jgi:hypothetical protein
MKNKKTRSLFDEEFRREKISTKDPLRGVIDKSKLGAIPKYVGKGV